MKGIHSLYLFVFLLVTSFANAQTATLSGRVSNEKGEALINITVYVDDIVLGITNLDGIYSVTVPANKKVAVKFSSVSYTPVVLYGTYATGERATLNAILKSRTIERPVVDIVAEGNKFMEEIKPKNLAVIPTAGAGGVEALLSTFNGVVKNNELSSQYSVRGGNYDENLVYINDIEVYRPFLVRSGQQEGLSFINPDMVSGIQFSAGGFEAKYGDRMSSVLDIKYRRPTRFAGSASASILGFTGQLEGISKNNRFTYLIGARQRSTQYLLNSLDTKGDYRPSSADVQAQLTYDFNENLKLEYLGSYSMNKYNVVPANRETTFGTLNEALRLRVYFDGQEVNRFDTYMSALSLSWQAKPNWLMKFITSGFQSTEQENSDVLGQYFLNDVETDFGSDQFGELSTLVGVGSFLTHARNKLQSTIINAEHKSYLSLGKHYLVYGVKWQYEDFLDKLSEWRYVDSSDYAVPSGADNIILLQDVVKTKISLTSNRVMGYIQDSYTYKTAQGHAISATAGVRANYWSVNNQLVISPRVQLYVIPNWKPDTVYKANKKGGTDTIVRQKQWKFKVAGGYYYQPPFYRELRNLQGQLNTDIRAQRSIHAIIGADHYFKAWKRDFKLTVEAYYKYLTDLIPYEIDNVRIRYYANNLSKGYAMGIDGRVNGEFVKGVESWFSLSIMKTAEDIRNDVYYDRYNAEGKKIIPGFTANQVAVDSVANYPGYIPRPMDQRVTMSLFFQDHLPKWPTFKMSMTLVFGTAFPFGPPDFSRFKDTLRMPFYRRVDIGFSKQFISENTKFRNPNSMFRHFKEMFLSLEIFNILGVNNTVSYTWIKDFSGRQYAIPNYLTNRLINLRLYARF